MPLSGSDTAPYELGPYKAFQGLPSYERVLRPSFGLLR